MREPITYHDRRSGALLTERVYADAFLHWLYNTRSGAALAGLLTLPLLSRAYGWANGSGWSRRSIRPFVERMGIDMECSVKGIDEFRSFNDFFTREIQGRSRPICEEPGVCVAPADGKLLAYPQVDARRSFRIKRSTFNLGGLLGDQAGARAFAGGSLVVSRLGLADCHHFHFPDSGIPEAVRSIEGRLHAGGPYALRTLVPFFTENHRMVTRFESDHFGPMAIVEIGALTVGSIRQRFEPSARVAKGDHKGFFELGGSTVVLLFRPGAIQLDLDLCAMTSRGMETFVRMGEAIGRAPRTRGAT